MLVLVLAGVPPLPGPVAQYGGTTLTFNDNEQELTISDSHLAGGTGIRVFEEQAFKHRAFPGLGKVN